MLSANSTVSIMEKKSLNCIQECEFGSKGTIKRKTRKCNLFCNIDTKKLNSGVARFTTCESNLSCSKSLCCRLRKVVAESREWFYFLKENLYMLRSPRQTCFVASDVTPMCGVQSEVSFHSTWNKLIFCCSGFNESGRTRIIAFQFILLQNKWHVFCCPFYRSLKDNSQS